MCKVTILDENGIPVTVKVSREIYQVFVDYEREVERQRKADLDTVTPVPGTPV